MLNNKFKRHLISMAPVSMLGLAMAFSGAGAAYSATPSLIGLSRDGSVYLERTYVDGVEVYRLVATKNGTSIDIQDSEKTNLKATALSPDGKIVAGTYRDNNGNLLGFVRTQQGVFQTIDTASTYANIVGVTDDGKVAGTYYDGAVNRAFVWSSSSNFQSVSAQPASVGPLVASQAFGISRDGSAIVGSLQEADGDWHAFVWVDTSQENATRIDTLDYESSSATLVSRDGKVAAGEGEVNLSGEWGNKVFRWTGTGGMLQIQEMMTNGNMYVNAMSEAGDVLVGSGDIDVDGNIQEHAYRYVASSNDTEVGTTYDLGTLGGAYSSASGISSNGKYIVGSSSIGGDESRGFRWTELGMISVDEWAGSGINTEYHTSDARYVSDDGSVVIGTTDRDTHYVARSGGIIEEATFYPTVAAANNVTVQNSVSGANTIMFGAQGNPMRNLLSVGQRSVWGTVDSGYDDNDTASGGLALGEFGFGYGIADGITARLAVGGTYTDQDLDVGGSVKQRGFYLSPEMSADIGGNVYLTVGGYWGRSSIDAKRGYMNGGSLDYSNGDTDADTWGGKIRFDWLNAVNISNTDITPYAALSYAHTTVDAYTETGGAFPVSYDETKDHSTIARLGADFVHPLTDTVRVLAKAEASYQFEDHSSATSGELIGISDFNLAGQDLKQFWVRGGVGAEFDVGGGTASFMVNATTQGQDPDVWVRSNFTVKF